MNRNEALGRLNNGEARFTCTAELFQRSAIRQVAIMFGVDFYEEKGWFSSTFIFRGTANNVLSLKNYFESKQEQVAV